MPSLFDPNETAFTETAGNLSANVGQAIDFTRWGTPERKKINEALAFANIYLWRTRGGF